MKYCKRCVIPDTRPGEWGLSGGLFDEEGVCLACRNYERRKQINWDDRFRQLEELCNKYRRDDGYYDCIIPVSGGKDSHYLVYLMKEQLGMNPLLINISDPFTHTKAGEANLHNISSTFNCDIIQFRISEDVFRRAVKSNFEEFGHPLILVEAAIHVTPIKLAIQFNIPFLVHGESNYEYGSGGVDDVPTEYLSHVNRILKTTGVDFWLERGFTRQELNSIIPQEIPTWLCPIFTSYYVLWDGRKHMEIAKRYGFRDLTHEWVREYAFENYDQIDSIGWVVALWLKFPKFGFARATDIACRWIREGRITREEAVNLVNKHDPVLDQKALEDFLDFTGYSVREFWEIVEKFWNKDIFEKVNGLWVKKYPLE